MKYRIIWIDDSPEWVRSVKDDLIDAFESHNFSPEIEEYQKVSDARQKIDKNYVDLIIIDCNLPEGINGDQFIKELREKRCFAHIVFYSNDASKLQLLIEDKHFLHVTHRDGFVDVLEIIADQAYRKYRHPAFMRGLLLSEFIDLENAMEDLVVSCFKKEGEYFRETVINKGGENYSLSAKCKFISRLIRRTKEIDKSFVDGIDKIGFSSSQFDTNIMKRRNTLAHAHPEYDSANGEIVLVSSFDPVNFNGEWFHETREHIHIHKTKIKDLIRLELFNIVNP